MTIPDSFAATATQRQQSPALLALAGSSSHSPSWSPNDQTDLGSLPTPNLYNWPLLF